MNRAELRSAVRHRLGLSANDPAFPDDVVNRQINLALRKVFRSQPNAWWFQHIEVEQRSSTSTEQSTMDVLLPTPDNDRIIDRVSAVFASEDGVYFLPIAPRERTDQLRLSGGLLSSSGLPFSWSVIADPTTVSIDRIQLKIAFEPKLPKGTYVRYLCVVGPEDLNLDADVPLLLPSQTHDVIVELAVAALARQRRSISGSTRRRFAAQAAAADQAAEGWLYALRMYFAASYAGAGYVSPTVSGIA